MPVLRAAQHIYTNVERDQSPANSAGFQSLYYTRHTLSEEDVVAIEERVFYKPEADAPPKRFFFVAPSGKWVVGNIVPIEGRDRAGRAGLYLAHSLIFSAEDATAHRIDPLTLLRSASYIVSREEAHARCDQSTGDIGTLDVDVRVKENLPAGFFDAPFVRVLSQLAIKAPELAASRKAVALVGSLEQIETALEIAYAVLPAQSMPACSFDTGFDQGGNLGFTYCWGAGYTEAPRHPSFISLHVDGRQLSEPTLEAEPESSYSRWIDALLVSGRSDSISTSKEAAWKAAEYLEGETTGDASLHHLDESTASTFCEANREEVARQLRMRTADRLPGFVVELACDRALDSLAPIDRLRAARRGLQPAYLLDTLIPDLLDMNEKELRKIHDVVRHHPDVSQSFTQALNAAMEQKNITPDEGFFKRWLG